MKILSTRLVLVAGVVVALIAAVVVYLVRGTPPRPVPSHPEPTPVETPAANVALVGTTRCSGRSCHGGLDPLPAGNTPAIRQDEFTHWLQYDKHSKSFEALESDLALRILGRLGLAPPATAAPVCLPCHTNPLAIESDAGTVWREERRMGVGCEACHGSARSWVVTHTAWVPGQKTAKEKASEGMTPLEDPAQLIEVCVGCHLGAPPDSTTKLRREVNHDLLAAGHPPLRLELRDLLAHLSPHWREQWTAGQAAKVWAAGQLGTTRAALRVLQDRAARSAEVWPEFAEYDCLACHHALGETRPRGLGGRPGTLPWGTWYFSMPKALAALPAPWGRQELLPLLDQLAQEMARPRPNPQAVEKQAAALQDELTAWQANLRDAAFTPQQLTELLRVLARDDQKLGQAAWASADQLYLALNGLHCSLHPPQEKLAPRDKGIRQTLDEMGRLLALPDKQDGPGRYPLAPEFDRERQALLRHLGP
jgi:hypothetical protein